MRSKFRLLCLLFTLAGCGAAPESRWSDEAAQAFTRAGLLAQSGRLADAADGYDEAARLDPTSSEIWLSAARSRARLGQWDAAIERAKRATELEPESSRIGHRLGLALIAGSRLAEARSVYLGLTKRAPDAGQAWLGLGIVSELQGDLEAAEQALSRAVELDPLADTWARLGAARERLGRPAAAAQAFTESVTLVPRRALARRALALAMDGGDHESARRLAQVLASKDAPKWAASLSLSAMLLEKGDPFAAASELEWVLNQDPENAAARLMLAHILGRVGRRTEALKHLDQIPVEGAARADALRLRGLIHLAEGQIDQAVADLERAIAAAPGRVELVMALARAQRAAGRLKAARKSLSTAIRRWPLDPSARYLHAMVIHDLGEQKAAMSGMRAVLNVAPNHPGALNYIGFTLAERGERLAEAERLILRALKVRPNDAAIIDSLGWVKFQQKDFEAAEVVLRRAVSLDGKAAEIRFHLAMALQAAGRFEAAALAYEAALKHASSEAERSRMKTQWRLQLRQSRRGKRGRGR